MEIKLISTGKMVMTYLMENGYKITDLVDSSCGVSSRKIYRFLNGEGRISLPIAEGVHRLINEISVDFLLSYDAKYIFQKKQEEKATGINEKTINSLITKYKLQQFFPELKGDKIRLFNHASSILGKENLLNGTLQNIAPPNAVLFSKANKADDEISNLWVTVAYNEARQKYENRIRHFNHDKFLEMLNYVKILSKAVTEEQMMSNIEDFCEECGINFLYRASIPNSRVKGATIKDDDGNVFILMSNLFKCIERFWLSFIHEILHIKTGDLDKNSNLIDEEEKKVDENVIAFLVDRDMTDSRNYSNAEIRSIAQKHNIAVGLVAEIARYRSGDYNNYNINSLIHYYRV